MGMELPKQLTEWLDKDWRVPPQNFVDQSMYYAGLDVYFMNYMRTVVRLCVAYSTGSADNLYNSGIKLNVGQTIKDTAVKLVKGDKIMFEGDDFACKMLSEVWAPGVGFEGFTEGAIDYMMTGGTTAVKLNKDMFGRVYPSATRVDRYYADTDDFGNVYHITFINSFLFSETFGRKSMRSYWLVEERYFNSELKPCVVYKVHLKSGVVGKEILPSIDAAGIDERDLPTNVLAILRRKGIFLNRETVLPFRDGLGVWIWRRTANNSCVPGLAMGDPLLYGIIDILWAIDVLFSGSVTDVILGKGKILVPKRYLQQIRDIFAENGIKTRLGEFTDGMSDDDDSLVYIYTEKDKDFTPMSVQFDIRSEAYRGMLEIYLQQAVTHCGFAPTSVFPFLQDQSSKTATEVTAEENLTRATIQSIHQTIVPAMNRMLSEVLFQYGFTGKARVKLSDYIGNKILRDQNIRENYLAGLTPRDVAVQRINDVSVSEAEEYMRKIDEEKRAQGDFLSDSYGGFMNNEESIDGGQPAEYAGVRPGRSGDGNQEDNEG